MYWRGYHTGCAMTAMVMQCTLAPHEICLHVYMSLVFRRLIFDTGSVVPRYRHGWGLGFACSDEGFRNREAWRVSSLG